jgi:very-short-patch-repair endonuclease
VAIAANPISTNQGFRSLIVHDGFLPEYVYYLLKANTELLKSHATGTTFGELSGSALKRLKFLFPSFPEQRAIAHILSSLDDKIELNRKMNETLEAIARVIFKRWFVDFEFPITSSPPDKEGWQAKPDGVVNNKKSLKTFRRHLQRNLAPAEAKLWTYLQNSKLDNRKFRRQHSVDDYILDFYCPSERLAIELDGEAHNNPTWAEYDHERDLFLQYYGIRVLRFENKVVFEALDYLLDRVREEFGKQPPRPAGSPPYIRRGV